MISDNTTFFLAFTAVFLGITFYLWRIDRRLAGLEADLESRDAPDANDKSDHDPAST